MGAYESTERIDKREMADWKAQRKMDRRSGRECKEDVKMQELEKVGRG